MVSNYTVCRTSVAFTEFIASNCARLHSFFLFMMDYTLENVSKNDWKLIIVGIGIKMSCVEKNQKINNQRGGGMILWDSRV